MTMKITVFGGASPKPDDQAYLEAYQLGRLLGDAGHTVLTGGYIGTMEAVSKGANEAGAHVIGITCDEIEHWRPLKVNRWVQEEIPCRTLNERLHALIEQCDAAIALPGGVGTLAEIAMLWNHMVIDAVKKKPLILIGDGWKDTLNQFLQSQGSYLSIADKLLISFATDIHSIIPMLENNTRSKGLNP